MMIYHAPTGATLDGVLENVWGRQLLVKVIDESDLDEVERYKADGWHAHPDDVADKPPVNSPIIDEVAKLKAIVADQKALIDKLNARLQQYESDSQAVGFEQMSVEQLKSYLTSNNIIYPKNAKKDELVGLAKGDVSDDKEA